MASSSRGRERREYRPVRRSRSPPISKGRSYSPPPVKRKASPVREREISRRPKISKSPVVTRGSSRGTSEHRYNVPSVQPDTHTIVRNVSNSDRFRGRDYDEERELGGAPQFRGPEGSVSFDPSELKKFTIEIVRNPNALHGDSSINRSITNPDDITPVRRPGMRGSDSRGQFNSRQYNSRGKFSVPRDHPPLNNHQDQSSQQSWKSDPDTFHYNHQNEGSRPLFLRAEVASSSKDRLGSEEYRRIVAIDSSRVSGGHVRGHSREREHHSRDRLRYSPSPYEEHRRAYYPERERSPYEGRHRSPHREEYVEIREKHRERRASSRDDLRRELEIKRREERRYSAERRLSYERESDLRSRLNEKRSESHARIEERDRDRRYESERERHSRSHHSPPPPSSRSRRAGSMDRHESSRRGEAYERERESERKRRPHSRERDDHHYEDPRRPSSHRDYEPSKKFYKSYEEKEFVPPPTRGRGGLPIRRGVPPIIRGRGIVRGISRGFRGGMIVPRGIPRGPFIPRGFPPRFFPPY